MAHQHHIVASRVEAPVGGVVEGDSGQGPPAIEEEVLIENEIAFIGGLRNLDLRGRFGSGRPSSRFVHYCHCPSHMAAHVAVCPSWIIVRPERQPLQRLRRYGHWRLRWPDRGRRGCRGCPRCPPRGEPVRV